MNGCRSLVLIAAGCAAAVAVEAQETRLPWRWTTEERMRARFDPAARAERVRAHGATHRAPREPYDVIDGNRNPELFLPAELFEDFVRTNFVTLPQVARLKARKYSDDLFLTEEDWKRVAPIVQPYGDHLRREIELRDAKSSASRSERPRIEEAIASLRRAECAVRTSALRSVRAAFGQERFDRYLYTVEARNRFISTESPHPRGDEERARIVVRKEQCP